MLVLAKGHNSKRIDVAIIGAGSAGLAALNEVRKVTNNYIVIDEGSLGTTCARTGCMPSKALIQVANEYYRCRDLERWGIHGGKKLRINIPDALAFVRKLRDHFAGAMARSTKKLGRHLVRGRAVFLSPHEVRVGKKVYFARRVILATGSRPVVPKEFLALGNRIVTTESLFELDNLPRRIGVVGLGPVGLEIGQALSRLGGDVIAFDQLQSVGKLTDPAISSYATRHFTREFSIHLNYKVKLKAHFGKIAIEAKGRAYPLDLILACLGRRPNLDSIGLEEIGIELDENGIPKFDGGTMKLLGLPIYLAGDVSAEHPILHEAFDDGLIAGYNSVHSKQRCFKRRVPLAITFTEPNLAMVGKSHDELASQKRGRFVTGEANFETQGRSRILGENHGLLHVYADVKDGKFLGAEMIGPDGEHLAHLMAWSLQQNLSVFEMLKMPFYHPVVEEGLRTALRDAARKVKSKVETLELAFCD